MDNMCSLPVFFLTTYSINTQALDSKDMPMKSVLTVFLNLEANDVVHQMKFNSVR